MDRGYRMSSFENRQPGSAELQMPETVNQYSPVEQVPFPDNNPLLSYVTQRGQQSFTQGRTTPLPGSLPTLPATHFTPVTQPLPPQQDAFSHATQALPLPASPNVTRILPSFQTQAGTMQSNGTTTALRQAVLIPGKGKKPSSSAHISKGRKWYIQTAILCICAALALLTGLAVIPLATGNGHMFGAFSIGSGLASSNNPLAGMNLIAQAATATAITQQDGLDQTSFNGAPPVYTGPGVTPNRFSYGQCTYWADLEYHRVTGYWVDWIGNAYQWYWGAKAAGWVVSSTPKVYSIIVLQSYIEGAGYYGHVAVVEKINPDGSVLTSNMNWYSNGGWNIQSWVTFWPGSGVSFVWHP